MDLLPELRAQLRREISCVAADLQVGAAPREIMQASSQGSFKCGGAHGARVGRRRRGEREKEAPFGGAVIYPGYFHESDAARARVQWQLERDFSEVAGSLFQGKRRRGVRILKPLGKLGELSLQILNVNRRTGHCYPLAQFGRLPGSREPGAHRPRVAIPSGPGPATKRPASEDERDRRPLPASGPPVDAHGTSITIGIMKAWNASS